MKAKNIPLMMDNLTLMKDICWWRTSLHQLPINFHDHLVDPFDVDVELPNLIENSVVVGVVLLWHQILYLVQHYHIESKS